MSPRAVFADRQSVGALSYPVRWLSAWLCRDAVERADYLDMQRRLRRPTRISAAIILAGVVPIVPFLHGRAVALVPTFGAFLLFALGLRVKPRLPYAQAWSLLAAAGGCVCATAALMLGDPHHLANLALLALPVVSVGARYPRRVMGVFAAFVCALLVGAALVDANAVVHQPLRIAVPLLVVGTTALFSRAVRDAERHFRSEALLDPLTGLFGRRGLEVRATELDQQDRVLSEPLAVLVVDVDHFKSVNDAHGHETGDRVLQKLAARLRAVSPDPGLAFRLGGEEFAILLPGADRELAQARGEQLGAAVRGRPVCGLPVTVSVGVAVREAGVADSVTRVLADADEALYEAKRSGRDRVVLAGERFSPTSPGPVPVPVPAISGPQPRPGTIAPCFTPEISEPPASEFRPSWLARDAPEHDRFLDMNRRMRPVLRRTELLAIALLVPCVPWLQHKLAAIPFLLAGLISLPVPAIAKRARRPEAVLFTWGLVSAVLIASGVVVARDQPAELVLLAWPVLGFSGRFPVRVLMIGAAASMVMMIAATLLFWSSAVVRDPMQLTLPPATLLTLVFISVAVVRSDVEHRKASTRDSLTALLNRGSLAERIARGPAAASAIMCDVDHFKDVNDRHGHTVGDDVLRGLADRIRSQVRADDATFRIGGDEFLVLLADDRPAPEIAERIRDAVAARPIANLPITISCGIAHAETHQTSGWSLIQRADAQLYHAKHAGRDRVCGPDSGTPNKNPDTLLRVA